MLLIEAVANTMLVLVAMGFALAWGMRGLERFVSAVNERVARDAARTIDDDLRQITD